MTTTATTPSRLLSVAAVPLMLLAGAMVAVQSQVNGRLAEELGDGTRAGILAACLSFGSGLVVVAAITAALPQGRSGARRLAAALRDGGLRPAHLVGGFFGALLVATQGLTVGTIGVALFSVAVTAGQSASALVVDHRGMGPSGRQPFSVPRGVAAAFAVAAVLLAGGERLVAVGPEAVLLALLPLAAGCGLAVQQALNGRVSQVAGPWTTTLNNFAVGTVVLLALLAASALAPGDLTGLPGAWWLYSGGVMGVCFIWLAAILVKVHGVLVLGLCMIAGQVVGAELLELAGPDPHVGIVGVVAGGLTIAGVLVALLLRPRTTPAR